VLFLQELSEDAVTRLKQAGLTDLLPHELADIIGYRYRGSGIYARYPLSNGLAIGPSYASQPAARLDLPSGGSVQLVCVHPHPPIPPWHGPAVPRWRMELAALPSPGDLPMILAGDYNATLDHAQFRRLLRLGLVDAASQVGNGLVPTWGPEPNGRPVLLPFDHVLIDPRCAVLATSTHRLPGSDHRALYAEFRLPA
jgi:endonuclease/exonuclease/phosphatase (EEP) superfamily protein YafD